MYFQLHSLKLYFHGNHARSKVLGSGNHTRPKRLGSNMPVTNNMVPILSRLKSGSMLFWRKNLFCNLFLTQNTLEIITNSSMASKNQKRNHLENHTQSEIKNQPEFKIIFSWVFKVQKHLIWTPRIKWNNLTQNLSFW